MDYVKVINPGDTYTTLCATQDTEFWGASITNNVLPIRGRTYRVIKELTHPKFPIERIMVIMDSDYAAFIVGIGAVVESNSEEFNDWHAEEISHTEQVKIKQQKPMRQPTVKANEKYVVGDIILVVDKESPYYNKRFRVTDPNYRGYDVVTSRTDYGNDKEFGFRFDQIERYVPEPELLPDDKPKFSKNELLEVLGQKKSAEEIILDLMDHITN